MDTKSNRTIVFEGREYIRYRNGIFISGKGHDVYNYGIYIAYLSMISYKIIATVRGK